MGHLLDQVASRLDVCSLSAMCRELIEVQERRPLPTVSLLPVQEAGAPQDPTHPIQDQGTAGLL